MFVLFGGFILANDYLKKGYGRPWGANLEIISCITLFYGSLFGLGLYKFFKYSWTFPQAIVGPPVYARLYGFGAVGWALSSKIRTFFSEKWRKA